MKQNRLTKIFNKLLELIRKFRTWISRMAQRTRSMRVQVTPKGKAYIAAVKNACVKLNTAANYNYQFVLNTISNQTTDDLDKQDAMFNDATDCAYKAAEAADAANITLQNVPIEVWDLVDGTTKRIEEIASKVKDVNAPEGSSQKVIQSLDKVKTILGTQLQTSIKLLQTLVNIKDASKLTEEDIKNSKPIRLTNDKASAKAADKVLGKEASESYDAVAMARAAASEGNLEAVVENMLISMGLIDGPDPELDALESEIDTSLLEADLLFV